MKTKIIISLLLCICSCCLLAVDLSKKITLNVNGETFTDICSILSKQTGLKIEAGESDADWYVYDRRALIMVNDVPMQDLLGAICNVFNFTCIEKDETLYFIQSKEQLETEAELVTSQINKEKQDVIDKKNNGISDVIKYSMDSNYENYKETLPYTYLLGRGEFGKNLVKVLENEKLKSFITDSATNKYYYNKLDKDIQELLYNLAKSYKELYPPLDIEKIFADKNDILVIFNRPDPEGDPTLEKETILGKITIMSQKKNVDGNEKMLLNCEIPILYPENLYTNIVGTAIIDSENGKSEKKINDELTVRLKALKEMEIGTTNTKDLNLADPVFSESINLFTNLKKEKITYNDVVISLGKAGGLNIISDCFYRKSYNIARNNLSLYNQFKLLSTTFNVSVNYVDKILQIKDNQWYMKRAGEIPSVWVDYWTIESYDARGYSLETLIEMADLTDLQIDYELTLNPKLNRKEVYSGDVLALDTTEVILKRDILRFLGSLDEKQTENFKNGKIMAYDLTDIQWSLLENAFLQADTSFARQSRNSQMITYEVIVGRFVEYHIDFYPDLSSDKHNITILGNQLITSKKQTKY